MNPMLPLRIARPQRGLSLIELMVSITLGMLVVAAVLALYLNITRTNNEMAKANRQIESGRFAIQVLQGDLIHAGFWGALGYTMAPAPAMPAPTAIPSPCVVSDWIYTWDSPDAKTTPPPEKVKNLLAIPVQGFADASTLTAGCGFNPANVLPSSDVLVVRHANTCVTGAGCEGDTLVNPDDGPHIQVSACRTDPSPEAAYIIGAPPAAFPLREKDCVTPAERRKIVSNIYYLANDANGVPNLMRAALIDGAYSVQPLIEGIEALRFEYGIDTLGRNGLPISAANPGDGSADIYESCPAAGCTQEQLANIVAVKIHVLARNLETTPGHKDTKSYKLGTTTIPKTDDGYKRHVFSTTVRLVNPSARREAP